MATEYEKVPVDSDQRPAYEPPKAVMLGELQVGSGGIPACDNGSAVQSGCRNGFSAQFSCDTGAGVA